MTPGSSARAVEPAKAWIPGALYEGHGSCRFSVWAPSHERIEVRLIEPHEGLVRLESVGGGFHTALVEGVRPGAMYRLRLSGGREIPDPASRCQPRGVNGPSAVVDRDFGWAATSFPDLRASDLVFYEIHTGTFTREGSFDAIVPRITELRDLGVTAIELMPVAAFPGERNWGYDGVFPFAVQESYGGSDGLRRLVDACHRIGLAVILDVVYNHLGPDGNYLPEMGPCFTDRHVTPWGAALNFDGPGSGPVRSFFIESALWHLSAMRVDGFRVDAIHAIEDASSPLFLLELTERPRLFPTSRVTRIRSLPRRFGAGAAGSSKASAGAWRGSPTLRILRPSILRSCAGRGRKYFPSGPCATCTASCFDSAGTSLP